MSNPEAPRSQSPDSDRTPPVGEPYYGVPFGTAFKRFFAGYAQFSGRASRSEFWLAYAWIYIAVLSIPAAIYLVGGLATLLSSGVQLTPDDPAAREFGLRLALLAAPLLVTVLAIALPFLAVSSRRLHDAGFSSLFLLLHLVNLGIVPLIMCMMPTSRDALKYGPGPVPDAVMPPPTPGAAPPTQ